MKRVLALGGLLALAALGTAQPLTKSWSVSLPGGQTIDTVARLDGNGVYWLTWNAGTYQVYWYDRYGVQRWGQTLAWADAADMAVLADNSVAIVGTKNNKMAIAEYKPDGTFIQEILDTLNSRGITITGSSRAPLGGALKQVILAGGENVSTGMARCFLRTTNAGANVQAFAQTGGAPGSEARAVLSDSSGAHWVMENGVAAPNTFSNLFRVRYNPGTMSLDTANIIGTPVGTTADFLVEVPSAGANYLAYGGQNGAGAGFYWRLIHVNRTTNAWTMINTAAGGGYDLVDLKQFNGGFALGLKRQMDSMGRALAYTNGGGLVGSQFLGRSLLNDYYDLCPSGATLHSVGTFQDSIGVDRLVTQQMNGAMAAVQSYAMLNPKMYRPHSSSQNEFEVYSGADNGADRQLVKIVRFRLLDVQMPSMVDGGTSFNYTMVLNSRTLGVMPYNITTTHPALIANTGTSFPAGQHTITRPKNTNSPVINTNVTVTFTFNGSTVSRSIIVTP